MSEIDMNQLQNKDGSSAYSLFCPCYKISSYSGLLAQATAYIKNEVIYYCQEILFQKPDIICLVARNGLR